MAAKTPVRRGRGGGRLKLWNGEDVSRVGEGKGMEGGGWGVAMTRTQDVGGVGERESGVGADRGMKGLGHGAVHVQWEGTNRSSKRQCAGVPAAMASQVAYSAEADKRGASRGRQPTDSKAVGAGRVGKGVTQRCCLVRSPCCAAAHRRAASAGSTPCAARRSGGDVPAAV